MIVFQTKNMESQKNKIIISVITSVVLMSTGYSQSTADSLANRKTSCLLDYFYTLNDLPDSKVLSGQWINFRGAPETPISEFDTAITEIYDQTGEWVSIIGINYMRENTLPYYHAIENLGAVNQTAIDYSNQNGIITIMPNFENPWTGGSANDLTGSTNLLDITTSGHPANINFLMQLDSVAKGLSQLQDSNVTVLFRPFHEMNGYWFWWGSKTATLPIASDYISLWQFTFDYLTTTKGLHNILWYYTPSARESTVGNPSYKTELFYYPGNEYVDVIGLDVYNDTLDIPNYATLVATGKPLGLAEFGPKPANVQNLSYVYDYTILLNQIKTKYPEICHWVAWNHFNNGTNWMYFSMSMQNNSDLLLADDWVVNRDEIDLSACIFASNDKEPITDLITTVFPNPSTGKFCLANSEEIQNGQLKIYNQLGQLVFEEQNLTGSFFEFEVDLPEGIYEMIFVTDEKFISKKLLLE